MPSFRLEPVAVTCRVSPSQSRKRVQARKRLGATSAVLIEPNVLTDSRGRFCPSVGQELPVRLDLQQGGRGLNP